MIKILPYQKIPASFKPWKEVYLEVAQALIQHIGNDKFSVIHYGSTAAKVSGKGIIDLSLLYQEGDFDIALSYLQAIGFQEQDSTRNFPKNRPRKDGAMIWNDELYLIHLHVIAKNSPEHKRQESYRNYLLNNPQARLDYERSKQAILKQGVFEQEQYGELKSVFVKRMLSQIEVL